LGQGRLRLSITGQGNQASTTLMRDGKTHDAGVLASHVHAAMLFVREPNRHLALTR
jgi:hypothetical protein